MLILTASQIRDALPMKDAIRAMGPAFRAFSCGTAAVPLRTRIDIPRHDAQCLFMPAYLAGDPEILALKAVSVFPRNTCSGMPVVTAAVLLMDGRTGVAVACMEGSALTAIRTGAASGLATRLLARGDSRTLAVIGAGVQARTQIAAVCAVRAIRKVMIYGPTPSKVDSLITGLAGTAGVPGDIRAAEDAKDAVSGADIICTATTSALPVFDDADIADGTHINAIGSFLPAMQEIPGETVRRSNVIVDSRDAALAEAGDLIIPIREGWITPAHIRAELGEIVDGTKPGRRDNSEITLFKSVGNAVQDAAAACAAYRNARVRSIGLQADWTT